MRGAAPTCSALFVRALALALWLASSDPKVLIHNDQRPICSDVQKVERANRPTCQVRCAYSIEIDQRPGATSGYTLCKSRRVFCKTIVLGKKSKRLP